LIAPYDQARHVPPAHHTVTFAQELAIVAAGAAAGAINAVVGAGTLITFSVLVALGVAPLTANVSNTVGLVFGSIASSWGYREELRGQRQRMFWLGPASLLGAITGAALLLTLPSAAFDAIVPALVLLGVVLVVIQPWLARRLAQPHEAGRGRRPVIWAGVYGAGVYGGYFGAAQGVLLIAWLGSLLDTDLQRVNALKNVLASIVNGVAALVFIAIAPVNWQIAGLLLVGAVVGGWAGGRWGRLLPDVWLRAVIVVVGLIAVGILVAR
jgi:uncharacterized membrane protein YfcA